MASEFFSSLNQHPPIKLHNSSQINYYSNNDKETSQYLLDNQAKQNNLYKNNNNLKILCDRNFIYTSEIHNSQKFGLGSFKRPSTILEE